MSTFSLGISGLSAAKKNLNTVGNNIANASTVGFKKSRTEFADVYAQSGLGSSTGLNGNGVRVSNIAQQFGQGGTTFTQNTLDLAIDGNGFFIVKDGNGTTSYTRAGMFGVDKEGNVVSSTGQTLQGYPANANGDDISVGVIDDILIPQANISPNATTSIDVAFNLDSRAEPPSNYIFDASDSDTYTHLYPSVVYDTLGNSHTMTQYFIKQPPYLPEYGEPTRAIQTLLGAARYGIDGVMDYPGNYTNIDGANVFPGDVSGDGDTSGTTTPGEDTLDTDIQKIFSDAGVNLVNAFGPGDQTGFLNAISSVVQELATAAGASAAQAQGAADDARAAALAVYAGDGVETTAIADAITAADAYLTGLGAAYTGAANPIATAEAGVSTPVTAAANTGNQEGTYSNRIAAIKGALQDMIDISSGRTQEFYESAYKAIDDYLPTVPSALTKPVFDGALEELEGALTGSDRAYAGVDFYAGELRAAIMAGSADPLTDPANTTNINLSGLDESGLENQYNLLIGKLETARDQNQGTDEGGVYQLALNVLQDIEKDWGSLTAAQETMVQVVNALESEAADNRWHMHVTVDGEKVTDGNENTPEYFSFNFTEFGTLEEPVPTMIIKDWTPKDGVGNQNGSDEPQIFEITLDGTTQFAGSFGANSLSQDGYATGELAGLDIDESGIIIARYTNSQTQLIGQVALANFRNEQGLTPVGGTMWAASTKSGDPVVNEPGVSIAGNIMSKALEDSNVDLSEELVNMIIAQRDYQANAKTLQTADTITQTIINLR